MNDMLVQKFLNDLADAMVSRDVDKLDGMLSDNAVLQHITGYLQPKQEWLDQVQLDYFTYREIYIDEIDITYFGDECVVEYNSTIIGNSRWEFRNRVSLKIEDEKLKWSGENRLWFR